MRRTYIFVLVFGLIGVLLFCGAAVFLVLKVGSGIVTSKDTAESVAKEHYEAIRKKDFDAAISSYSPEFFRETSREDWLQTLKKLDGKLGDLKSYDLQSFDIRQWAGAVGSGTYYVFQYKVTYSKYSANETMTLFKPIGSDEITIIGHQINSQGLLKD